MFFNIVTNHSCRNRVTVGYKIIYCMCYLTGVGVNDNPTVQLTSITGLLKLVKSLTVQRTKEIIGDNRK